MRLCFKFIITFNAEQVNNVVWITRIRTFKATGFRTLRNAIETLALNHLNHSAYVSLANDIKHHPC